MNLSSMSKEELEEFAIFLDMEIQRISLEWHEHLPELKHNLVKVQNEMSRR